MKDNEYLINRVTTANGPQLVAILYEEMIESLKESINSIKNSEEPELKASISKCRDILAELMSTLEGNSEIASHLRSIYLYVNRLITEGTNQKDLVKLEDAINVLNPLYEGWKQLGEELQTSSAQQGTAKVTGFTYGKTQLNDYVVEDDNKWKKG